MKNQIFTFQTIKRVSVLIFLSAIGFISCHDHNTEENVVTIEISHPENNEIISNAALFEYEVIFSADESIHKINISIVSMENPLDELYTEEFFVHKNQLTLTEKVDLSSSSPGTTFILKVTACGDHDCQSVYEKSVHFSI